MAPTLYRKRVFSSTVRQLHRNLQKSFREVSIPVPWGKIAGKWWGPTTIKPILCLHGIQDNCGTFDRLIPFLSKDENISFLAIDFPGHGYSSSFPRGMLYDKLCYTMLVSRIYDYFKWPTMSIMGHSVGAMTLFSYALCYPEKVNSLICIDSLKPIETPYTADILRNWIDQYMKYEKYNEMGKEVPYTLDEIIQKITSTQRNSIKPEYAHCIFERNISASKEHPGKYYFTRDPLLKLRILFPLPQSDILKDTCHITHPIFVCKAAQSSYYEPKENFYKVLDELKKSSRDCEFHILEGTHHLHLNEPEKIGSHIANFLNRHYEAETSNLDDNSPTFCEAQPTPLQSIRKYG